MVHRPAARRPRRLLHRGIAETNRPPFDLPEAETELVAGYHTEYSGMRFGLFSTAEYINMITLSGLAVTLFLGGWDGPWGLGPLWFVLKLGAFLFVFIWLRATLPRLRYDQLMRFGWKVLLPVATINALDHGAPCGGAYEPAARGNAQGLRGHLPPDLRQADHAAVPRVQAAALPALPRPPPPLASRERAGEVRRLLAVRRRLPGRLHPRRRRREHAGRTASRPASATRASTRSICRAASSAATASSRARSTRSRSSRSSSCPSTRATT